MNRRAKQECLFMPLRNAICGSLFLLAISLLVACGKPNKENSDVISRLRLLPATANPQSDSKLREGMLNRLEDKTLAKIAATGDFTKWKKFKDEFISFSYPDNENIELEVKNPEDPIPIMGSPVGTTENTSFKSYRLALGKFTYALVFLDRADHFDDGICFCGSIAYSKYLFHNGAICRFDFLEDGNVKKIQMLSNGFRVAMLEWTHLPMRQNTYLDIGLSIRIAAEPCDEKEMMKKTIDKYGFYAKLGFLEKGMPREKIIELLGNPISSTTSSLTYVTVEERWKTTTEIHLDNGVFMAFKDKWQTSERIPAKRGTVEWIIEAVPYDFADSDTPKKHSLSEDDIACIFNSFLAVGENAKEREWNDLCAAISHLSEMGIKDKKILPLVRKRFAENIQHSFAAWILHDYDPEGSKELFASKIRFIFDDAAKENSSSQNEGESFAASYDLYDLHNLFCFLDDTYPQTEELILKAMDHRNPTIRSQGYGFYNYAPANSVYTRLIRGLGDDSKDVRKYASKAFAETAGSKADIPILKARLSLEKDDEVANNLKDALKRLEK